ncbi:hypothetical protein RN001_006712 [Aquatica leii]|uniref:Uncharacterized protein n=1 Tax=Aquatica leii TaxID=1421715 RepID=A0AAN7SQB2_9COLE|nr:hypothetical protein RN001_006712 [Aquatica leii]
MKVMDFMEESDECQFSIAELEEVMKNAARELNCELYSRKQLQNKLVAHFGQKICITELSGKNAIVNFKETFDSVLYEKWYKERNLGNDRKEQMRIVKKAAEIIRQDIRSAVHDCSIYPAADNGEIFCHIPDTLKALMETIITSRHSAGINVNKKRAALSQAIVSACRPRSFVPPILLGIGVYVHRHFGSRQLVDFLHNWGFSVSYKETYRYKNSVIKETTEFDKQDGHIQYCFDNADFNIKTLTGHDTFHSLGGIRLTAPAPALGNIPIVWYKAPPTSGLKNILAKNIQINLSEINALLEPIKALDLIWLCSTWSGFDKPPSWNGTMKKAVNGNIVCNTSKVTITPFINIGQQTGISTFTVCNKCYHTFTPLVHIIMPNLHTFMHNIVRI